MRRWIVPAIPLVVSLGLSLATVGRHPYWQDSGVFLTAVKELGVLYPPGFCAYLVLCRLWTAVLFFADFTLAVHLFSSICSALAAATMAVATRDLLRTRGKLFGLSDPDPGPLADACGIVAGVLLASGYTFWTAGIYAKGYAFYYFVLSLLVWRMIRADESGRPRDFTIVAALIGLAWQAHPSAALTGAALAAFVAVHARTLGARGVLGRLGVAAAMAVGPSLVIVPLLMAREPWLQMGHPETPGQFLNHVTGRRFVGMSGAFGLEPARVASFGQFLWEEFLGVGLLLATAGLASIAVKNRRLLAGILLWLVPYAVITILFRTEVQHDHWFVAAWLPLSLAVGVGACRLGRACGTRGPAVVAAAGLVGMAWAIAANYANVDQRTYDLAELYGRTILEPVDSDGVLVLYGDDPNALAGYVQRVRGVRTDVALVTASFLCYRATGGTDWYDDALLRRHPFLRRPDYVDISRRFPDAELVDAATAAFLNANFDGGRPMFTDRVVAPAMIRPDAMLVPAGPLWKLVSRTAPPPFDPRYWKLPIEPERVRGHFRRERGQIVRHTSRGFEVKADSYENRLLRLLIQARINLARTLTERGQFEPAAKLFESVVQIDPESPNNPDLIHFAGICYHALGQDDRAEPLLLRSSQEGSRPEWRATAAFYRGEIARKRGDEAGARRLFEEALGTPGLSDAYREEMRSRLK